MRQVLQHRNIGGFTSITHLDNLTADDMQVAISEFLEACDHQVDNSDESALLREAQSMRGSAVRFLRFRS